MGIGGPLVDTPVRHWIRGGAWRARQPLSDAKRQFGNFGLINTSHREVSWLLFGIFNYYIGGFTPEPFAEVTVR